MRDMPRPESDACDVFHLHPRKVGALRARLLGDGAVTALAETFRVLGDGTRVRILDALSRSELCVCDLATLLGVSESAVSHQLRLLRGMRLVRPRRDGRMVFYTLDDEHIVRLFEQGLEHVEERQRVSSISAKAPGSGGARRQPEAERVARSAEGRDRSVTRRAGVGPREHQV
jgi:ArsR family transcriptional regulator